MAVKVNQAGLEYAHNLIKGRRYDKDSDWGEAQPSTEDENKVIAQEGWDAFAKWHLAVDTDENEETKGRYKFPFGDFDKLHHSALIAIKQRAGSEHYEEVQKAVDELLGTAEMS